MTLSQLQQEISRGLRAAGLPDSRREAAYLIGYYLDFDLSAIYTHPDFDVPDDLAGRIRQAAARRAGHEPMAYITGSTWFMDNRFTVGTGVLVPRPDSEVLVEQALALAGDLPRQRLRVLDACTGSGCVGISIGIVLHRQKRLDSLLLSEIDPTAARYAGLNLERYPLDGRAKLALTDLLPGRDSGLWDLIVANPPYIARPEIGRLMPEVSRFEPRLALDGGPDGLDYYRRLITGAPAILQRGGVLLLEHGFDQADSVRRLFEEDGRYEAIPTTCDYGGQPRVSGGIFRS